MGLRVVVGLIVVLFVGVMAVLAAAIAQRPPEPVVGPGTEWQHVLQVITNLRASPPDEPVVLLFGGSAARESTVSDVRWQTQVRRRTGHEVLCFNLGSNVQSFADDVRLVRQLPDAARTPLLIFIGVNPGRFCLAATEPSVPLPPTASPLPSVDRHRYDRLKAKSSLQKKALVAKWLQDRYPVFKRWYSYNLRQLALLVETCQSRGIRPVLLDLPRNASIVGHALDEAVSTYRSDCRRLAAEHDIPWVGYMDATGLANRDFYDLWHMLDGPGRRRWQRMLSETTAALLREYGMKQQAK